MRQLTVEEIRSCVGAGGVVTSGHITGGGGAVVTAWTQSGGSPTIPGDFSGAGGGGGGHSMLAAPVGGGGGGGVMNSELKNALEALMKEISLQSFGSDVLGSNFSAIQAGNISLSAMTITFNTFSTDFTNYTNTGCACDVSAQGSLLPLQYLNWSEIDPQQNMTESQVIAKMTQLTSQGVNIWNKQ